MGNDYTGAQTGSSNSATADYTKYLNSLLQAQQQPVQQQSQQQVPINSNGLIGNTANQNTFQQYSQYMPSSVGQTGGGLLNKILSIV